MIGNDVVDLELAKVESNWRRKGYLRKLFTEKEIANIANSSDQDQMVWTLWTCKESAYKIVNRQTLERRFNPIKFECVKNHKEEFDVIFSNQKIFCRTKITEKYIYTEAVSKLVQFDDIEIYRDSKDIAKVDNIPNCGISGNPVSVTHHGNYHFAIILNQTNFIPSLERSFKNDNANKYASLADEN